MSIKSSINKYGVIKTDCIKQNTDCTVTLSSCNKFIIAYFIPPCLIINSSTNSIGT